jgi:hypothetical protein
MSEPSNIVKLHLSGSICMASHLDMQKIWITGLFFENRLHGQYEVEKKILQMAVLGYIFIYKQIQYYLGDDCQLHS